MMKIAIIGFIESLCIMMCSMFDKLLNLEQYLLLERIALIRFDMSVKIENFVLLITDSKALVATSLSVVLP